MDNEIYNMMISCSSTGLWSYYDVISGFINEIADYFANKALV